MVIQPKSYVRLERCSSVVRHKSCPFLPPRAYFTADASISGEYDDRIIGTQTYRVVDISDEVLPISH